MATSTKKSSRKATNSVRRGKKSTAKKKAAPTKKWSSRVTHESNALDLDKKVFTLHDPKKIAQSLKSSAEKSKRRKGTPFQSAMSMLNFYLNRAGKNLSASEKKPLQKAKSELRALYGKEKK
jgi:hypothetical protein